MYYVYLLESETSKETYVGSTTDLRRRLNEHNNGFEISTKRYMPWRLVAYEAYVSEDDAREREQKLKSHGNAMKMFKQRARRSFKNIELSGTDNYVRNSAGFSTIELMIAFAIIALALTGVIVVVFGNQAITLDAELNNLALYKAERHLEDRFGEVKGSATGFDNLIPSSIFIDDISTTTVIVTPISDCVKRVESTNSWWEDKIRPQDISLATVFTSLEALKKSGNNCDTEQPESDWDNPATFGEFKPTGLNIDPTALDVVRRNGERLVFMTSMDTVESRADFWVIDATDEENPVEVAGSRRNAGGCQDAGSGQKPCGLTDVVVAGDYAYVTSASSTPTESSHEVEIINITNPSNPFIERRVTLGITPNCPGANCPGGGRSIAYHNGRIYVGTHRIGGPEFFIIDANPATPTILDDVGLSFNHNVNDIVVWGDYAYLATSDNTGELLIYSVAGDILSFVGAYDAPGDADATSLYLSGNEVYLGRQRDASNADFFIINVLNPLAPTLVGSRDLDKKLCLDESNNMPKACLGSGSAVEGISVRGNMVFLIASQQTANFQIWLRDGNTINPVSRCNAYNYAEKAVDLDFFENFGFVANGSTFPLRIVGDQESVCTN